MRGRRDGGRQSRREEREASVAVDPRAGLLSALEAPPRIGDRPIAPGRIPEATFVLCVALLGVVDDAEQFLDRVDLGRRLPRRRATVRLSSRAPAAQPFEHAATCPFPLSLHRRRSWLRARERTVGRLDLGYERSPLSATK